MESERSAASLAMQSHHILFWSCRHWGSPLSPLLTIRTCHWISFKKKRKKKGKPPIFPYSLRPYLSAFSLLLIFFFLFLVTSPASAAATTLFFCFLEARILWWLFFTCHCNFSRDEAKDNQIKGDQISADFCGHTSFSSSSLFIFCSPAIPSDYISVDILPDSEHANDMGGKKEEGGGCGEFAAFGFIAPSCSSSSSPSSFPWVEQKWAGEAKHAEK